MQRQPAQNQDNISKVFCVRDSSWFSKVYVFIPAIQVLKHVFFENDTLYTIGILAKQSKHIAGSSGSTVYVPESLPYGSDQHETQLFDMNPDDWANTETLQKALSMEGGLESASATVPPPESPSVANPLQSSKLLPAEAANGSCDDQPSKSECKVGQCLKK